MSQKVLVNGFLFLTCGIIKANGSSADSGNTGDEKASHNIKLNEIRTNSLFASKEIKQPESINLTEFPHRLLECMFTNQYFYINQYKTYSKTYG